MKIEIITQKINNMLKLEVEKYNGLFDYEYKTKTYELKPTGDGADFVTTDISPNGLIIIKRKDDNNSNFYDITTINIENFEDIIFDCKGMYYFSDLEIVYNIYNELNNILKDITVVRKYKYNTTVGLKVGIDGHFNENEIEICELFKSREEYNNSNDKEIENMLELELNEFLAGAIEYSYRIIGE